MLRKISFRGGQGRSVVRIGTGTTIWDFTKLLRDRAQLQMQHGKEELTAQE